MASITQIRGVLLEEIVLYLLEKVGYRIVNSGEEGTRTGGAGLEIQGRGEWHQVDALAAFDYTPSFMYPLRLIVEAKCYNISYPVPIEVARNSLGVLRDITENYFTYPLNKYLFCWDKIPGTDNGRLIEILISNFGVAWARTANIVKTNDTINVSSPENFLSIKLNNEQTKSILTIDDGRTDEFIAKMENGNLNIYLNDNEEVQVQRFNYHSAIFSTSGYTEGAQHYAIAHQIFLIQYQRVPLIRPIVGALREINAEHFKNSRMTQRGGVVDFAPERPLMELRTIFRKMLRNVTDLNLNNFFTESGINLLSERILAATQRIKGSYYGMLQGRYPMHLLSKSELPAPLFQDTDEILCRIHEIDSNSNMWSFVPTEFGREDPNFFELQFDLPDEIALLLSKIGRNPEAVANLKRGRFSYLNIAGKIGGIRRQVRLRLDETWLNTYLEGVRRR